MEVTLNPATGWAGDRAGQCCLLVGNGIGERQVTLGFPSLSLQMAASQMGGGGQIMGLQKGAEGWPPGLRFQAERSTEQTLCKMLPPPTAAQNSLSGDRIFYTMSSTKA